MSQRKEKIFFNKDLLDKYVLENNVILNKVYNRVNRETIIDFTCNCGNKHTKTFRQIFSVSGALCKECTIKIKMDKIKKTMIELYNVENAGLMENHVEKMKETNLNKFGYEFTSQCPELKEKMKETSLKNWGYEHASQSEEFKEKVKNTNLKKFGTEYPMQSEQVQNKLKENNLKKYGVEYYFQTQEFLDHLKEYNLKNFGVEYASQNKEIKKKIRETNLKNFGVEYASQNLIIQNKILEKSLSRKEFIMPSGDIRYVQGYEPFALKDLLEDFQEEDIITDPIKIPVIQYIYEENIKFYFPDIFIPKINKIIEVKSKWTFEKDLDKNKQKEKAVKELGYNFSFWIYNEKGIKEIC